MPDYRKTTLLNINGGAVLDLFEDSWEKLLENIADPNTEDGKSRELTIKLKVAPSKERVGAAHIQAQVTTKLPGNKSSEGILILETDRDTNKIVAYNIDPKQPEFQQIADIENGKIRALEQRS